MKPKEVSDERPLYYYTIRLRWVSDRVFFIKDYRWEDMGGREPETGTVTCPEVHDPVRSVCRDPVRTVCSCRFWGITFCGTTGVTSHWWPHHPQTEYDPQFSTSRIGTETVTDLYTRTLLKRKDLEVKRNRKLPPWTLGY